MAEYMFRAAQAQDDVHDEADSPLVEDVRKAWRTEAREAHNAYRNALVYL